MDIELVAKEHPEKIQKEHIDVDVGLQDEQLERLAKGMGFSKSAIPKAIDTMRKLYELFMKSDGTQIESIHWLKHTREGCFVLMQN
eukprot:TRINITY_DN11262_c0_g1_i1.p1 TRINITY_DN11262_c0_g1~~TRINITY_DN11262_c0_g1_i1.p1  ORF type:complete len:86 (-),score=18.77 TRINITY_DN11262_c0_g1_i1:44-301(-)